MKNKVHLIMPMGGKGSRFFNNGFTIPKPLIDINGKPFLYWSTKSITEYIDVQDIIFVILEEHIKTFFIDKKIKEYFPTAKIVTLPKVLNGAVLTSIEGVKIIDDDLPIIFNDCDHMFKCSNFNEFCNEGIFNKIDGALLTFESNSPKYSYIKLDENKNIIETKEKEVISNQAICGTYYFKNKSIFLKNAKEYLKNCNYNEFYISGVYNEMIKNKLIIKNFEVNYHIPFGTPEEYQEALLSDKFKGDIE